MKKVLFMILLAITGTLSFLTVQTASASVYSNHRGENPCLFTLENLQSHGYVDNATYTAEGIHELLHNIDVHAKNVDTLIPGQRYQLAYSCYMDKHVAHPILQALPVNNPGHVITNIYWTATKPTI